MTDDPNARPSLSERYGVAVGNGAGMEHMILAAGMQHERLGAILLRLQTEYDAVKGDLERAGQIAPQRTAQARDLTRRAALAERLPQLSDAVFHVAGPPPMIEAVQQHVELVGEGYLLVVRVEGFTLPVELSAPETALYESLRRDALELRARHRIRVVGGPGDLQRLEGVVLVHVEGARTEKQRLHDHIIHHNTQSPTLQTARARSPAS